MEVLQNNETFISVVINGYNTRDYIKQCVESVIEQDFDNYEVLIIDDGSTDDSPEIGEQLAATYPIVKAFTKENGGLADARNYGVEKARGEYILFIDGDDYIEKNSINKIWQKCIEQNKPDIVFLQAVRLYENKNEKRYDSDMDYCELSKNRESALKYISERNMYPASAWRKMIKRQFLIDNNISFKKGQSPEDYEWSIQTFLKAKSFGCCNSKYYFYRQKRKGSISNTANKSSVETLLGIVEHWVKMAESGEYSKEISLCIKRFAAYVYRTVLWYVKPYYNDFYEVVQKYSCLLDYKESNDVKLIRLATKLLGVDKTVNLLDIYKKIRR